MPKETGNLMELSLLIFSIESKKEVMALVNEMYGLVDEVVIIDGSSERNHNLLLKTKKEKGLERLKVFRAVALGYAEPYRTYGIKKCSGKWILLLDSDERLSRGLKRNLRKIIDSAECDVFRIKRYENYPNNKRVNNFYTWQIRLFRKGSLEYLGLTHEHPKIHGRLGSLQGRNRYIKHLDELRHARYYNKMDLFSDTNVLILLLRDIVIGINTGEVRSPSDMREVYNSHMRLKKMQTQEITGIGKIIREKGVTKYLGLEKDETVEKLNRKYAKEKGGIDLLIKLLIKRYRNDYP